VGQDRGNLQRLETGKAKLVRHLEGGRQNHAERLAAKLLIAPAIGLFKGRVNRHDLPKRICEHKRAIPLLQLLDAGNGYGITTSRFWPIRRLPISLVILLLNQARPRNGVIVCMGYLIGNPTEVLRTAGFCQGAEPVAHFRATDNAGGCARVWYTRQYSSIRRRSVASCSSSASVPSLICSRMGWWHVRSLADARETIEAED